MIFNTAQDLLNYYEAKDEAQLDRRFYKNTNCGAWVKILGPGPKYKQNPEIWIACIQLRGEYSPKLLYVRQKDTGSIAPHKLPVEIKEYLQLDYIHDAKYMDLTEEEVQSIVPNGDDILTVTKTNDRVTVTFQVKVSRPDGTHAGALVLGSIVEGSDAEVLPREIFFPFTQDQLDAVIEDIML